MTDDKFTVHEPDGEVEPDEMPDLSEWPNNLQRKMNRERRQGEVWCLLDRRCVYSFFSARLVLAPRASAYD